MFDELEKKLNKIEEMAIAANQNANFARSYALQAMDLPFGAWVMMGFIGAGVLASLVLNVVMLVKMNDVQDDTKSIREYISEKQRR